MNAIEMNAEMNAEMIEDLFVELECAKITMQSLPTGSEEHHEACMDCLAIQSRIKAAKAKSK